MADQTALIGVGFGQLVYNPGNPTFPTLPTDTIPIPYVEDWSVAPVDRIVEEEFFPAPAGTSLRGTASGFADWYLNKIWTTPQPIDFGDIADQKDVEVTMYSTYPNITTLSDVDIPVTGVDLFSLTSPQLPLDLQPFGDQVLTFRADQLGPNTFDDDITVTLDVVSFEVRTLGRRVLLLFAAQENGIQEQLVFATNLMRSKNGYEQAFSLRKAPYGVHTFVFRMSSDRDAKRTELEAILLGGAPTLTIGVQYWFEAQKLTSAAASTDVTVSIDTSAMQIAAGQTFCFALEGSDEVVTAEIESFTASDITFTQAIGTALPANTMGMPVRFGHMEQTSIATALNNAEDIQVSFRTEADIDVSAVDTNYFDTSVDLESPVRPIIRKRCAFDQGLRGAIFREEQRLDSITGRVFVTGTEDIGEWSTNVQVHINSHAELYAWRQFLHSVRGSWGTFYLPSFQNDLPLAQAFSMGGNTFVVPFMGIEQYYNAAAPRRDLRIVLSDGNTYYRRITDVTDNGNGTETVTVSAAMGSGSPAFSQPADTFISWLNLVRIDGDQAVFNHTYRGYADLTFSVRTVKEA